MPLFPTVLEQMFLSAITRPPSSAQALAEKLATAYETYGRKAIATGVGPVVLTGVERVRMQPVLMQGFYPPESGNPWKMMNALCSAIQIFWLGVPAGAGFCTAFLGRPAMEGILFPMRNGLPAAVAAKLLAQALDAGTRLVQVTVIAPPTVAFLA